MGSYIGVQQHNAKVLRFPTKCHTKGVPGSGWWRGRVVIIVYAIEVCRSPTETFCEGHTSDNTSQLGPGICLARCSCLMERDIKMQGFVCLFVCSLFLFYMESIP